MISRARSQIICDDIIVLVLLQHLHVGENIVSGTKGLDKPGPRIRAIAKNLALHGELMRPRRGDEVLLGHLGMRRERVVERKGGRDREQTHAD